MMDFPWFKFYPEAVPKQIDPEQYNSAVDLFEESIKKYGDAIAYECMDKTISFNELDKLSANFASFLQNEFKLKKGDRIGIQMPNLLQYPIVMFGALRAGLIVVNTNPLYTSSEMEHQFSDAEVKAIVIVANFAHNLEKIKEKIGVKKIVITEIGDSLGGFKGTVVNLVVKYIKKMVPAYNIPEAWSFKKAMAAGESKSYERQQLKGEDLAFLQYTGGTTGVSKGAMLSHANIVANMQQISAWMKPKLIEREETVITALPLYHIFALTVNCLAMMKIGAHNVLITNPRDMPAFCKTLKKHPFSVFTGVNTLFNGLLNQEAFRSLDFSSLKISVAGGMALQSFVAKRWKEVTGVPISEGYGLTETSPVVTCNPIDGTERIGTIGIPLPNTEVKIVDDAGNDLALGERGELCVKGPQVMPGYWERPDETADSFIGKWFKTGDIAVMDADGFFKIVDRKKEMILVSGFNVYPNEVEDALSAHDMVNEVGVIGIPDERSTERVIAYVVLNDKSLTAEDLIAFSRGTLTSYKVPKEIYFVEELPKSNVGKILRRVIKENHVKKMAN
ncbi:AMP-binding protein [uncultured Cyclobacterium sp.]|uniref:AMP-binding protein n=1 Tax=uncultured Cyclobacterium sp. TaxID=453820 RepID=UPI0030EF7999|tara:strand:- start:21572 stop:23254 length:1683 start_codon:yes stop_codon:yes gene_type:complete